jgi:hypothetical protein
MGRNGTKELMNEDIAKFVLGHEVIILEEGIMGRDS